MLGFKRLALQTKKDTKVQAIVGMTYDFCKNIVFIVPTIVIWAYDICLRVNVIPTTRLLIKENGLQPLAYSFSIKMFTISDLNDFIAQLID